MSRGTWLVYGPPEDNDLLVSGEEDEVKWTIHRDAKVGDTVLFYLRSPVSAIVAAGRVVSSPQRSASAEKWSKVMPFDAVMRITTVYEPPLSFRQMADDEMLFAAWTLLGAQMQSATGPQRVLPNILALLRERHGLELDD
jgi:hypothetical protein